MVPGAAHSRLMSGLVGLVPLAELLAELSGTNARSGEILPAAKSVANQISGSGERSDVSRPIPRATQQ